MKRIYLDIMPEESVLADTHFGIVTTKRVIFLSGMKWGRGGSRQDVPIQHITAIGYDVRQNILKGIFWIFLGVLFLIFIIGVFWIKRGLYYILGHPTISINTSGLDKNVMTGKPLQRLEADRFIAHLRQALFSTKHPLN